MPSGGWHIFDVWEILAALKCFDEAGNWRRSCGRQPAADQAQIAGISARIIEKHYGHLSPKHLATVGDVLSV